ncbi:MAG: IS200/IS605 family transposase [Thermoplasmatota archaeon]
MEPIRGPGGVHELQYHVVWCPKYRNRLPDDVVRTVDIVLRSVCEAKEFDVRALTVMPDHVHLFVAVKPDVSPAALVKVVKGVSAKLVFEKHPRLRDRLFTKGHLWSPSYYVGTVGHVSEETVRKYVESQKQRVRGRPRRERDSPPD